MATYRGSIFKRGVATDNGHSWRNVYWVTGGDPDAAMLKLEVIADAEAAFHSTEFQIWKLVVDDPSHIQNPRITYPNILGEFVRSGSEAPLFLTVRADFIDLDHSRPERKYYRLGAGTGNMSGQQWETTVTDLVQSTLDTLIGGSNTPSTPTGGVIQSVIVDLDIQMRQVSWHRRSRPGFHRAYVPNV